MEKFKQFWLSLVLWPGWTGWLKWEGWKKMGAWSGWKRLLYPHPAVVILLTLLTAAGLPWIFFTGREYSLIAYPVYCTAFYALVTLIFLLIKVLSKAQKRIAKGPLAQKLMKKKDRDGAFGIGIYVKQFINFFYGIFKIASGAFQGSAWLGADGIYNLLQALIQLYQILRHRKVTSLKEQWKAYRQCGFMMIALHLTMTGMIFQMIHMGQHKESTEIMIIATAAFTFYKLIITFVNIAKDRKHKKPVDSAVRFLNFSQALYNLFVLQVGLLWVFGGSDFAYQKLMNSLTGGAVCVMVCGMGFYMLWRSRRDMKTLEEENG